MRVICADKINRVALHPLITHPDVSLNVFHDVADMELAVGIRQGGGDEELFFMCGHSRSINSLAVITG